MDLDSPFHKTVILEKPLGQAEEFEVRQVKIAGENLEMLKLDKSVLVAPRAKVRAILPRLPADSFPYRQQDAQKALVFLQGAQKDWPGRSETSFRTLAVWKQLAEQPSLHEQKLHTQRSKEIQQWLEKIDPDEGKAKPTDLAEYLREGEDLAQRNDAGSVQVRLHLEKIRNLMSMDLEGLRSKQLPTEWNELGPILPLILAAVLLILGLWTFGNIGNFSSALKAGMVRSSQKGGETRTSVNLKGIVYLVYAGAGGALVFLFVQAHPFPPEGEISEASLEASQKALYLSMNTQNRWSSQPRASVQVEAGAAFEALQKLLPQGEFRLSQVLAYLGPKVAWRDGNVHWRQTLKLVFIPLHLDFFLRPSSGKFLLEEPFVERCQIGLVPLGGFVGQMLWRSFHEITAAWDQALGLQSGVVWTLESEGFLRVETPQVVGTKDERKSLERNGRKKFEFKDTITASELAQVFAQGDGDVYVDRIINLVGRLKSVSSRRRLGNTMTSEVARKAVVTSGGLEAANAVAPAGLEDLPDEFYLESGEGGLDSKIQVKVLVKSPQVYQLDGRGDLYHVGTNPNLESPIVARQKRALFKGGRVEGMERDVIEVYGAQPPEEVP